MSWFLIQQSRAVETGRTLYVKLELWSHTGPKVVDLEGIVKDPPKSADLSGGISFNYVLDVNPIASQKQETSKESVYINYSTLPCSKDTVKVAIVDSGVDAFNNSNLTKYNWSKIPPFAPSCPIYPAILNFGYNLIDHSKEPQDENGHGMHVNGIAAGISPHEGKDIKFPIEFLNIKFTSNNSRNGTLFKGLCGLYYALDQNSQVINISWGFMDSKNSEPPKLIEDFLNEAKKKNVLVVTAMGNEHTNLDAGNNFWPASFAEYFDNVISVGAVDNSGNQAVFSNWATSKNKMTIAAHGVDIKSTYIGGLYATQSGTSMAAPYVTRTAAAIRSIKPSMSASDVKTLIVSKSKKGTGNYRILEHFAIISDICK
jgi:thermitase